MKKQFISYTRFLAVLAAGIVFLVSGCTREHTFDSPEPGTGEVEVLFSFDVPAMTVTRGMDGSPEKEIRTIDLLLFEKSTSGADHYYRQWIKIDAADITQVGSTATFKAKMTTQNKAMIIVALANARDLLQTKVSWLPNNEPTGTRTKKGILDMLWYNMEDYPALQNNGYGWNAGDGVSGTPYVPVPMYGEKEVSAITPTMPTVTGIELTRMLARIDVKNADSNFSITNIHLVNYHYANKPFAAYDTYGNGVTLSVPRVNNGSEYYKRIGEATAITYPVGGAAAFEGGIYVFESVTAGDGADRENNTCLIIEGTLNGQGPYFYRVDFINPDAATTNTYLHIWRNHHYIFTLDKAAGPGAGSITEAIAAYSEPPTMKFRLHTYNQSKIGHIAFSGQYMLGIGRDTYSYGQDAAVQTIPVYTNYPGGWEAAITAVSGGDWLTFNGGSTAATGVSGETSLVLAIPTYAGTADRSAKITLKTKDGQLILETIVTQTYTATTGDDYVFRLLDANGNELPTQVIGANTWYYLVFGLHIGGEVPPQRIYIQYNGGRRVDIYPEPYSWIGGAGINANDPSTYMQYASNNTWPQNTGTDRGTSSVVFETIPGSAGTLFPFDVVPAARSATEVGKSYDDRFQLQGFAPDWSSSRIRLRFFQIDWVVISDLKDQLLGTTASKIAIEATSPWTIADIYETVDGEGINRIPRKLLSQSWNTSIGALPSGHSYLNIGATGGAGATTNSPVSDDFYLLTEKWIKGRKGKVTVVFRSTAANTENYPDIPITFNVTEEHLDYTSASTQTPMFYTFPVSFRNTAGDMTHTWDAAVARCQMIGDGWRLPSHTENTLMFVYGEALRNAVYHESNSYPYTNYVHWYSPYWSLGQYTSGRRTYIDMGNGFLGSQTWPTSPQKFRCVYTTEGSGTTDPSFSNGQYFPNPGQYYPYITSGDSYGPVIVSRANNLGANAETIGPVTFDGTGLVTERTGHNKVEGRLQVYYKDANASSAKADLVNRATAMQMCENLPMAGGNSWRLPTEREMWLIAALGGSDLNTAGATAGPLGYTTLGDLQATSSASFEKLTAGRNYWTSSSYGDSTVGMTFGSSRWDAKDIPANLSGDQTVGDADYAVGAVRCVRKVND